MVFADGRLFALCKAHGVKAGKLSGFGDITNLVK